MKIKFYRRSGERVSQALVERAKRKHEENLREGINGLGLAMKPKPEEADAISRLSLMEWCLLTDLYTYCEKRSKNAS
ncbi:hypothetical protein KKE60_05540 [Patescibacteria group bacterium]|nr:hypothetical protein [Patescibacteria group bacterium]